jgi:hypothetical protein
MGRYVGRLIAAQAAGRAAPRPFRYRHYGDLATIGRKAAVVRLRTIHLTGFVGWLFWSVAHVYFLIGVRNRLAVVQLVLELPDLSARCPPDHGGRVLACRERPKHRCGAHSLDTAAGGAAPIEARHTAYFTSLVTFWITGFGVA